MTPATEKKLKRFYLAESMMEILPDSVGTNIDKLRLSYKILDKILLNHEKVEQFNQSLKEVKK